LKNPFRRWTVSTAAVIEAPLPRLTRLLLAVAMLERVARDGGPLAGSCEAPEGASGAGLHSRKLKLTQESTRASDIQGDMETFTLYVNPRRTPSRSRPRAIVTSAMVGLVLPVAVAQLPDLSTREPVTREQAAAKFDVGSPLPPVAIEHATVMLR
jgi:hypothetical protein